MKSRVLLTCATMLLAFQVHAETANRSVVEGETVIAGGVGNCSIIPQTTRYAENAMSISTDFTYITCEKTKHYQVEVSGSFWNTKDTEIQDSARYSYRLTRKSTSVSRYLNSGTGRNGGPRPINAADAAVAAAQVQAECLQKNSDLRRIEVSIERTGCAGQTSVQ